MWNQGSLGSRRRPDPFEISIDFCYHDVGMRVVRTSVSGVRGVRTPMKSNSVVIADRYPIVLQGLNKVLGGQQDFDIVASCANGASCIKAIRVFAPDLAVVDFPMPGFDRADTIAAVVSENIATRLVFFTASIEEPELVRLASAGACGIIAKDAAPEVLLKTLRQTAQRLRRPAPLVCDKAGPRDTTATTQKALAQLTDRERQIMRLVSEGLSNKEIGRRLNLSDGTIKVHLHHIFCKLEISSRALLAAVAMSQNQNPLAETGIAAFSVDGPR